MVKQVAIRPLTDLMREQTNELHQRIEHVQFTQKLFLGVLPKTLYARYLSGLLVIYMALESELIKLSANQYPALRGLRPFFRAQLIQKDLLYILDGREQLNDGFSMWPQKIAEFSNFSLENVLALTYVRFLGDIGGGQILLKRIRPTLGVLNSRWDGVQMYRYDQSIDSLRKKFKAIFNDLSLTSAQKNNLLQATSAAFEVHIKWFECLM